MKEGGFCIMHDVIHHESLRFVWRHLTKIFFFAVTWRMVFRLATRWTLWLALMQVSMETRTISMTGSDVTLTKERSQVKPWNPQILMSHSIWDNLKESSNCDDSFNLWLFKRIFIFWFLICDNWKKNTGDLNNGRPLTGNVWLLDFYHPISRLQHISNLLSIQILCM